jgi:hypothetical protein
MDDRSGSSLVNRFAGDGWLLRGGMRLGQVTYAIDIFEVRASLGGSLVTGTEARVRLLNHSLDVPRWQGEVLTHELYDGRHIAGFMSDDGAQLVRTGALL